MGSVRETDGLRNRRASLGAPGRLLANPTISCLLRSGLGFESLQERRTSQWQHTSVDDDVRYFAALTRTIRP